MKPFPIALWLSFGFLLTNCSKEAAPLNEESVEIFCSQTPKAPTCPGAEFEQWLDLTIDQRPTLREQSFASIPLSKFEANTLISEIFGDFQTQLGLINGELWRNRELRLGRWRMPFFFQKFGNAEFGRRSLFISMHGGGGAPAEVNDEQYRNQQHLYDTVMRTMEGIYLAPRAPEDASDMWYKDYIDEFFDLIIQLAVLYEGVDPNRVYLTGYSAGGDGVYQLAPRMADRWAATAMMAGHPNAAHPYSLANTPFISYVGAQDTGYDRNLKAAEWGTWMSLLKTESPELYHHSVNILEGYGHWMELQDSPAFTWMYQHTRESIPKRIHWQQTTQTREHFYWLSIPREKTTDKKRVTVELFPEANQIHFTELYSDELSIWLNDDMLDLDKPVIVTHGSTVLFEGMVERNILNMTQSLERRGDRHMIFSAKLELSIGNIVE